MPFAVDFINEKFGIDNSKAKFIITGILSFVIALAFKWQQVQFGNVEEFYQTAGVIFGESQAIFKLYWEKSGTRKSLIKKF